MDVETIKMKMKNDGFEYIVKICAYERSGFSYERSSFDYYLFAKPIGSILMYKIVNFLGKDFPIERITPITQKDINLDAKFEYESLYGRRTAYFKLPDLL